MRPQISAHRTGLATAVGTGDPVLRLPARGAADHLHHQCIESLNSKAPAAVRSRGHFPDDEAATKLLFLVLREVGPASRMGAMITEAIVLEYGRDELLRRLGWRAGATS